MRRWQQVLLFGLCGLVLIFAVAVFCLHHSEPEPIYKGRPLSQWLDDYNSALRVGVPADVQRDKQTAATAAVRSIGSNAVPFLVRWHTAKDSTFQIEVTKICNRIWNTVHLRPTSNWLWKNSALYKRYNARISFIILRTEASSALPEVARQFAASDQSDTVLESAICLSQLGTNGLKVLLETIQNPPSPLHFKKALDVICYVDYLGTNAAPAIPVLISVTKTNHTDDRWTAAIALGALKIYPQQTVPALRDVLQSTNSPYRAIVIRQIGAFGKDAKVAVPDLAQFLNDKNATVAESARNAIYQITNDFPAANAPIQSK